MEPDINTKIHLGITLTVVLSLTGIVTNAINLIIFNNKDFKTHSIYFYLTAIAYYDIIEIGLAWLTFFPNVFFTFNGLTCKITTYISKTLYSTVSWTITIYSIDRVFWLVWPMTLTIRKSQKFQLFLILLVLFSNLLLNIPFILYYESSFGAFNETIYCEDIHESTRFIVHIYYMVINLFMPFVTIFITAIVIVIRLFYVKSKIKLTKNNRREIQFTRTIILMDIVFMIFKLPAFFELFWFDWYPHENNSDFYYKSRTILYILKALGYTHNSSSFFIYLTFNKLFRAQFFKLIKKTEKYKISISQAL